MQTMVDQPDAVSEAKSRIHVGPEPAWLEASDFDASYKAETENPVTCLLHDRQENAETRETYLHIVLRLETMQAVQNNSQWRLDFEPGTDSFTLHFIRIRRGATVIDQLQLDKAHLLRREEGLNRLVIDGWFTFLLVLEDVRPGDILEWAWTGQRSPRLLPRYRTTFFPLPEWTSIGKYRFAVRFDPARGMKWKSSSADLKPTEQSVGGLTIWTWAAEKYVGKKREPNTPSWFISAPLIQTSDCPDWQTVAAAVAEMWAKQAENANLNELESEVLAVGADTEAQIGKAIDLIQENFRYLSVNLEFGGQIPTPPEIVARRRYGDCKDLSFLLSYLLRRLGVNARPILVHTGLRSSVGELLPTPGMFDHAIVEFEYGGKTRWVDATMKRQGGGAFNRVVSGFGLGLPVDSAASGLIPQPGIPDQSHAHELHETILIDTTGEPSRVAMVVRAEGLQAEILRREFEDKGVEEMEKQSLLNCVNRFGQAKRVGKLQFRDDRASNHFFSAEVFDIQGFLQPHPDRRFCRFRIPSFWINHAFPLPEEKERTTPFALLYPCQVIHIIDVESPSLRQLSGRQIEPHLDLTSPFVRFKREKKTGFKYWVMHFTVTTTASSVPANQIAEHRRFIQRIWKESAWELILPVGVSRTKGGRGFGELPSSARQAPRAPQTAPARVRATPPAEIEKSAPHAPGPAGTSEKPPAPIDGADAPPKAPVNRVRPEHVTVLLEDRPASRHRRKRPKKETALLTPAWIKVLGVLAILWVLLLLFAFIMKIIG